MPNEADPSQRLSLSIPKGTEHIGTVRAFIGAAGAHLGLSSEEIDDLKLAVSEVCGEASTAPTKGRIQITVDRIDGGLMLEVIGLATMGSEEGQGADPARAFRRRLIDALVPDAVFTSTRDGMAVRFTVAASG